MPADALPLPAAPPAPQATAAQPLPSALPAPALSFSLAPAEPPPTSRSPPPAYPAADSPTVHFNSPPGRHAGPARDLSFAFGLPAAAKPAAALPVLPLDPFAAVAVQPAGDAALGTGEAPAAGPASPAAWAMSKPLRSAAAGASEAPADQAGLGRRSSEQISMLHPALVVCVPGGGRKTSASVVTTAAPR